MDLKLEVGIFQFDIIWHNIKRNQEKIEDAIQNIDNLPDVIILPEMYSTGFTMTPDKLTQENILSQIEWQTQTSVKYNIAIMGSAVIAKNKHYRNRFIYTSAAGELDYYDKRHLFLHEKKSGLYKPGGKRKCFLVNGMKVMPQICYDLRFPVWTRNNLNYEVLIFVANWPSVRQHVWESLLKARAIENQCYVIGVNRVGEDGNNIKYSGGSVVFSPKGETLLLLNDEEEFTQLIISRKIVQDFKSKFPVHLDADKFSIH